MAAAAVSVGIGAIVPKLGDQPKGRFVALGIGYGVLALVFVIGGSLRGRQARQALASNRFVPVAGWLITAITVYLTALVALTALALV